MQKLKKVLAFILSFALALTLASPGSVSAKEDIVAKQKSVGAYSSEKDAYLILPELGSVDLTKVPVNTVLDKLYSSDGSKLSEDESAKTVWATEKNLSNYNYHDKFKMIDRATGTLDLITGYANKSSYEYQLILGSGLQMDSDRNVKYNITVYPDYPSFDSLSFTINQDYSSNYGLYDSVQKSYRVVNGLNTVYLNYVFNDSVSSKEFKFSISNSRINSAGDMFVKAYNYSDYIIKDGEEATDISSELFGGDGIDIDLSDSSNTDPLFVLVYTLGSKTYKVGLCPKEASGRFTKVDILKGGQSVLNEDSEGDIETSSNYCYLNFREDGSVSYSSEYYDIDLKSGNSSTGTYSVKFTYSGTNNISKIVKGYYTSSSNITSKPDIKSSILGSGYSDSFSYGSNDYTVLFTDGSYSIWYIVLNETSEPGSEPGSGGTSSVREYTGAPVIRERDPWFYITGISSNGSSVDNNNLFIVQNYRDYTLDTMYSNGFQTVLIKDKDVDLSKIKLQVSVPDKNKVKVYLKDGTPVSDPDNMPVMDFTYGPIQIYVTINGKGRNYWIDVKKMNEDAPLYVSAPLGSEEENAPVHEVLLDQVYDYKHDILVANLGERDLSDISVVLDLKEGKNHCKIDEYYTIGGDRNDTLSGFTTVAKSQSNLKNMKNIAKIRLVPDGEGDIEGKLVIKVGEDIKATLILKGTAQNPKITTEQSDIRDGVKYVPYSMAFLTNNMHDWIKVNWKATGLPSGMSIISTTGELYGVPKAAGEFEVTVTASYSSDRYKFDSSTKTYTLVIKDNEDSNVYLESDEGFEIETPVGTLASGSEYRYELDKVADTEFTSIGTFGQFVDLWLNGEKLEKDTDYTAIEGSTKITIKAKTINKLTRNARNTIAAEFRKNGSGMLDAGAANKNDLTRTSQNFYVTAKTGNNSNNNNYYYPAGGTSSSSSSTNTSTSKPADSSSTDKTEDKPQSPSPVLTEISVDLDAKSTVASGVAEVSAITEANVKTVIANKPNVETLIIDVSDKNTDSVKLTKGTVDAVSKVLNANDNKVNKLEIITKDADIVLDTKAVSAVLSKATADVVISVKETSKKTLTVNGQGKTVEKVLDVTIKSGNTVVSDFNGGSIEVGLSKFKAPNGRGIKHYHVYYTPSTGEPERCTTWVANNVIYFRTTHLSEYALVYDETMENGNKISVFRLYNPATGDHLLTTSAAEKANCIKVKWRDEGIAFTITNNGKKVYRIYNRKNGEHFYTTNEKERDTLLKLGWSYEGSPFQIEEGIKTFRLYNGKMHFFTANEKEKDALIKLGWKNEKDSI